MLNVKVENFKLPQGMNLVIDDMGWLYGRDQRDRGLPSRTGIPRAHTLEDYQVIEAIGEKVDMKINAMFVIGEWDRRRTLAKVPGSNKWGADWERSEYFDEAQLHQIRDFLNSSRYIELGFHGLLHDSWDEKGNFLCDGEFFLPEGNVRGNPMHLAAPDYIRRHMDAFFEIYHDWDLKCPIRTYASPCGSKNGLINGGLTPILKEYGIRFWHNGGKPEVWGNYVPCVQNGVVVSRKAFSLAPWEAYDLDPEDLPMAPEERLGILCGHWVNFLRYNPKRNMERVDAWAEYIKRQAQNFGVMQAQEVSQCHYQGLYVKYATVTECNGAITVDVSQVDALLPGVEADLFVNVKGEMPQCVGGEISLFRKQDAFATYRIRRQKGVAKITLQ